MPSNYKKGGVLCFIEATLNFDINDTYPHGYHGLSVKEVRKILDKCPLDSICGAYCRRLADNAAIPADRIRETLGDESEDLQKYLAAIIYTCVVTITG